MSPTVTPRQGEAIVAAVWTRERQARPSLDCSHLVHEIYSIAGLRYPYTDSFDLYAGIEKFVRVTTPQPGDLIVWRGHVGIVIDPTEHSFYSSLNSGLGTDFYDAPYWKARGSARFYRYAEAGRPTFALAEQRVQTTARPVKVISSNANSRDGAAALSEDTEPKSDDAAVPGGYESPYDTPVEIPSSILVTTAHRIPTQKEVAAAVSELNDASGSILKSDLTAFSRKVVIYDHIAVEHVDAKGQQGSAKIQINSRVTLTGRGIERHPSQQVIRWKLSRTIQGWQALRQPDCVYVPRDVAVHELAARLALLTENAGTAQTGTDVSEQAKIVHILNTLVPAM